MQLQLGDESKTLLMPLWGRAKASRAKSPILSDSKAVEIVDALGLSLKDFDEVLHPSNELFTVARARAIDDLVRGYLVHHPRATVVNLGAGLDTGFYRVDNGLLRWFDVDLPHVTTLRLELIGETDRSKSISASITGTDWIDAIGRGLEDVILVASGVLVYLEPSEVVKLFVRIGEDFPGAEFVFDIQSRLTNFFGNRRLRAAGMGTAKFRWGGHSARQIAKRVSGIEILEEFDIFSRVPDGDFPDEASRRMARMMNRMRTFTITHLRLNTTT